MKKSNNSKSVKLNKKKINACLKKKKDKVQSSIMQNELFWKKGQKKPTRFNLRLTAKHKIRVMRLR